mgnify:CR=1 FL=1
MGAEGRESQGAAWRGQAILLIPPAMTDRNDANDRAKDEKAARLAEQLRANLRRRKTQSREMKAGDADSSSAKSAQKE